MIKRIAFFLLSIILVFSMCACHAKDEIAVTINDLQISSGAYMNILIAADSEASTKVEETLTAQGVTDFSNINIYAQKIDGVNYSDWVKNRAIELCKRYAAIDLKANELGVTLDQTDIDESTNYVDQYWANGIGAIYEENGVSYNTYLNYYLNNRLGRKLFEKLFGEGGEKAADKQIVLDALYENYEIANIIDIDTADMSADEVAADKAKLEGYIEKLKNGTPFEEIYVEYYEIKDHSHEQTEEETPKDLHATLIGSDETEYYADADFDTIKAMAVGEIKILEDTDADTLRLVVRGDIKADGFYEKNLYNTVLYMLYDQDFEKYLTEVSSTLQAQVNNFAVDCFKVKKIKYS